MPRLNTRLKQPVAALWYTALGAVALSLLVLFLGLFVSTAGGSCTGDGCGFLNLSFLLPIITLVSLLILAYPVLYWHLFSYELTERNITVNSGILFRQYETIDFGRVQTIDNERGPLLWFFGLTMVELWTASADQISFSVGSKSAEARPRPDTVLILKEGDAQALKDFVMRSKNPTGL
jgi:uncharacterized membrane protein YdbT with pleckstrin-like domain